MGCSESKANEMPRSSGASRRGSKRGKTSKLGASRKGTRKKGSIAVEEDFSGVLGGEPGGSSINQKKNGKRKGGGEGSRSTRPNECSTSKQSVGTNNSSSGELSENKSAKIQGASQANNPLVSSGIHHHMDSGPSAETEAPPQSQSQNTSDALNLFQDDTHQDALSSTIGGTMPHSIHRDERAALQDETPMEFDPAAVSTTQQFDLHTAVTLQTQSTLSAQIDMSSTDDDDFDDGPGRRCSMQTSESASASLIGNTYVRKNVEEVPKQANKNKSNPYSRANVRRHETEEDLWVIIRNNVYNLSDFVDSHPGGQWPLLQVGGKDATKSFESQHGTGYLRHLKGYLLGPVPEDERL